MTTMKPDDAPLTTPPGTRSVAASGLRRGQRFASRDCVAEEVPVAEYVDLALAVAASESSAD